MLIKRERYDTGNSSDSDRVDQIVSINMKAKARSDTTSHSRIVACSTGSECRRGH